MLINKLRLEAFGPFKDKIVINFDFLNQDGIFLLTGPTGVGKTSIFDAIIFALYGEVSKTDGPIEKVRSDYANPEILTYVELDFTVNGVVYHIRREPTQIKMSHDKEVLHTHQVFLYYGDSNISGIREVNSKIEEIIGLNSIQFRQIVMIPQGEFVKLLNAKSEEKGEILGKIFDTSEVLDFQNTLIETAKSSKKEIDDDRLIFNTKLSSMIIDDDEYKELISRDEMNYEEVVSFIKKYMNESFDKLSELSTAYEEQEKLFKKKNSELQKANENNEKLVKLDNMKKRLFELKEKREEIARKKKAVNLYKFASMAKNIENDLEQTINDKKELLSKKEDEINELSYIEDEIRGFSQKSIEVITLKDELSIIREKNFILNEQLKRITRMNKINEENSVADSELKKVEEKIFSLNEQYQSIISEQEALQNSMKINETDSSLYDAKKKLELDISNYKELEEKFKRLEQCKIQIRELDNDSNELSLKVKEIRLNIEEKQRRREENIIGNIASNLIEGVPCPVCGSTSHPNPKVLRQQVLENTDLNALIEKENNFSKVLSDKIGRQAYVRMEISSLEQELRGKENISRILTGLNTSLDDIEQQIFKLESQSNQAKKAEERFYKLKELEKENEKELIAQKEIRNEILVRKAKISGAVGFFEINQNEMEIQNEIDANKMKIETIQEKINSIEEEKRSLESRREVIRINSSHYDANIALYDKDIKAKRNNYDLIMENFLSKEEYESLLVEDMSFENYKTEIEEFEREYNSISNNINDYEYMLMNVNKVDVSELKEIVLEEENKMNSLNHQKITLETNLENNRKTSSEIYKIYQSQESKWSNYEKIARLSKAASGGNGLKMSFEKFVLAVYFEEILICANKLLLEMSNNRYSLVRNDQLAKGNAKQGLDILVYDSNTGKLRDVKTLSGGESFKAALCLALGLAEVVRWRNGGVELNTMFIDEGFGSLDPESLDSALNVLTRIKDDNRTIGIISHVTELKERIPSQIVFEATIEGSKVVTK